MNDLRLRHTPPVRQRGHWTTTITVYVGDAILYAETLRLDDPAARTSFAEQIRMRSNGHAPDVGVIEQRLLAILDAATSDEAADAVPAREQQSQATRLVRLALDAADLFHDETDSPYARLAVDGHTEVWPTHAKRFKTWLAGRFYATYQKAVGSQALADALLVIDAEARFHGPCRPVYLRMAPDGMDGMYLDLADPNWRAVHITPSGWQIVHQPPVCFRRSPGMLPLPDPVPGGRLDDLRALVNVPDDDDWALITAWLRSTVWPVGPYPVLVLKGEHGSGKTTLAELVRLLVDPADPVLRSAPRERRDLMIAARANWIVAFDNVSYVEPWMSDDLCRLATGAGWATRELYSDSDETIFKARRPVLLNGIEEFIGRTDLLDRTISVVLPPIDDRGRRLAQTIDAAFAALRPSLLGALLDSASGALRAQGQVRLPALPRMADFAVWAVAAERAAGEPPRVLAAYVAGRVDGQTSAIDESVVGRAILAHLVPTLASSPWDGTAADLLTFLLERVDEPVRRDRRWPKTPRGLAGELRRLAPAFRLRGVSITFVREALTGRRVIRLACDNPGGEPSLPSLSSLLSHPSAFSASQSDPGTEPPVTVDPPCDGPTVTIVTDRHCADAALLTTPAAVAAALPQLLAAPLIGVDCETTGLDPRRDRLRLIQLATPERVCILDAFRTDVRLLAPLFAGDAMPTLVGHNLKFDLAFLAAAGLPVPPGSRLFDTMLAAQLLDAGLPNHSHSLAAVAERALSTRLEKTLQTSDWHGPLSDEQLAYAARDAAMLLPLHDRLAADIDQAELGRVAQLEMRALPAVVWLEATGAPFDVTSWLALSDAAQRRLVELDADLTRLAGTGDLLGDSTTRWSSPAQVLQLLQQRGHAITNTDEATLVALAEVEPIAALLLDYREASRRASTYGAEFRRHVADDGRIHPDYRQIGAATGRMACSQPNLQQVPRDPAYRACFRPGPGRVLVKADYSQIELRIAAEIAGDQTMLAAYQRGDDLHTLTARLVLGRETVTKADRQAAKALNFGLIYGMGAATLRQHAATAYGVQLTDDDAQRFRTAFFQAYPGLRAWHRSQPDGSIETRTLAGRRRQHVERFTEKLNTPVQGTGADGLKAALALLWETRDRCRSAVPVLVVHDEIVVECDAQDAAAARDWLTGCMTRGMAAFLRQVPVEVEATVCQDWSGTPVTSNAA
jgi:DNA polymerase-1